MKKVVTLAVVTALSFVGLLGNARAADKFQKSFDLPATLMATLEATACSGAPGPQVSLQGDLVLSGVNAEVMFKSTGPQVPGEPFVVEQVVVPPNQHKGTPPASITGGVSNDPYIWLEIRDAHGRPLTSEILLGRCSQGAFAVTANFAAPVIASADVSASSCSSAPTVSFDGAAQVSQLTGRLIFRSEIPGALPPGQINQATSEIMILPEGHVSYPFSAQPAQSDSGTNPLISVQFRRDDATAIGSEVRLGRCSSLVTP